MKVSFEWSWSPIDIVLLLRMEAWITFINFLLTAATEDTIISIADTWLIILEWTVAVVVDSIPVTAKKW